MSVNSKMTAIADAIRNKTKKTGTLTLDQMATDIASIDTSKPEQTKTATPSLSQQTIVPDSGKVLIGVTVEPITSALLASLDSDFKAENIAEGVEVFGVTGTMATGGGETGELGIPTVSSSGLVTATVTKGGVIEEGTSTTLQLSTQGAKTVTPSSSAQTAVAAGKYTTGAITVGAVPSTFKRVATGTATASTTDYKITVNGLGFKPNNLILIATTDPYGGINAAYGSTAYYHGHELTTTITVNYSSGGFTAYGATAGLASDRFYGSYYWVAWS